jgi:hypothetical protein
MSAPKTDYEEEFFHGMTVPRLAQLFGMDRRTVTEKVRALRPCGERRGTPVYHVRDVAPYLVEPIVDIEKYLQNIGPSDLPASLQHTYWNAQNGKLKYKENAKELWRTGAVMDVLIVTFRSLTQTLRLFADRIEAIRGLTPEQRRIIEHEISDTLVNTLRKNLIDDFSMYNGFQDKEPLADIKLSELDEEEESDDD